MLEGTVGENLRGEQYVHKCHKTLGREGPKELLCVGFIEYLVSKGIRNQNLQIGIALGLIDIEMIEHDPDAFETWEEVLESHRLREAIARLGG